MAKRLRAEGRLPAVVYGEDAGPVVCSIDQKELEDILHAQGRNAIVSLQTEEDSGAGHSTIIKEIQHHPVRGYILHVDFHRIDLTHRLVVEVPVAAKGTPAGVRNDGGILEHMLHYMEVECLPTEIPDVIEVDVSELTIGDAIHVEDIQLEGDVQVVTEADRSLFVVVPPTVRQEDEEEGEEELGELDEEMQEPEVIERGKREDEDEEE